KPHVVMLPVAELRRQQDIAQADDRRVGHLVGGAPEAERRARRDAGHGNLEPPVAPALPGWVLGCYGARRQQRKCNGACHCAPMESPSTGTGEGWGGGSERRFSPVETRLPPP